MKLFKHLSGSLHFAATSKACNISPSALSRTIRRLEEESEQILFIRDNRKVELTDAGKRYLQFTDTILEEYRLLMDSYASKKSSLWGTLRIDSSVTASYTILSGLLKGFQTDYPDVHIDLKTGSAADAIDQIIRGNTDISVAAKPDRLRNSLAFRELAVTPLHFVMPKIECPVRKSVSHAQINWEAVPFILSESGIGRMRIDRWFRHNHLHPNIYAQVAGNEAILAMVGLGLGVGLVPGLVLDKSPLKDDIEIIKNAPDLEPYTVGICTTKRLMNSPLVKALWEKKFST
ncbi:MAG: HTH-type transcriptional activator IlvY [Spirochaetales bacterium]|nr:HTH-type transcriptional activator IlvY [Spirochaetales bacterium]